MLLARSILWWLALTLSALVLGGSSLLLLQREQSRLQTALGDAERSQVQAVAERLASNVQLMEDQLGTLLANGGWRDLASLERTNPLVRNVYVFDPKTHMLRQPNPNAPASTEEEGFLRRYEPLFADRRFWQQPADDASNNHMLTNPALRTTSYPINPQSQAEASSAQTPSDQQGATWEDSSISQRAVIAVGQQVASGFWLPWVSDNRLHIIGGIQLEPDGPVYGVEIEIMALVSRLSIEPPEASGRYWSRGSGSLGTSMAYLTPIVLLDGSERPILMTEGVIEGVTEDLTPAPDFRYPVGTALPHWQLGVFRRPDAIREASALSKAGAALVLIMVVAILGGGASLFVDARRSRHDARQRTTFVSNVSHELKTPLTSIRMYAELLRDDRVPDEDRRRRFLDTMVQEGERLTRLIDNVLDFGRLEQSRRNYHPQSIDLADIVRATLDVERERLAEAGLQLTAELPDRLPLTTDPDAVRQILLNLLDNAAKYAADGKTIQVSLARDGSRARLAVQDAGPGIPPTCRERIFGMFERLDNSLEAKAGSGLGLAIARGLARGLGGDLTCSSAAPHGACFTLFLPCEEPR